MGKYRMNWKNLLSASSQRPRSSRKTMENMKIFEENRYMYTDLRSDFERDYHRILSSPSFRRLQDKTQVFPLEKNDFIRTRLTHSIEVSSFGKSLAQSIADEIIKNKLDEEFTVSDATAITNILASAGLLHDIGNPPFGHFGEDTIRDWFSKNIKKIGMKDENGNILKLEDLLSEQMKNDLLFFEGNAQAIRVVSKLHFLVDENGMNLTYALLNTLVKYPVNSLNINKESGNIKDKKMGYNLAEEELFREIVENTGTYDVESNVGYRHPLTFILEAADDIAYCTADIEDGMKKGFINFEKFIKTMKEEMEDGEKIADKLMEYREYAEKRGYDSPALYAVQRWVVSVQGMFIRNVVESFIKNYDIIMNGEFRTDLFEDTESEKLIKILKKIAFREVFESKSILKMEITASNILNYFMDNFINSILYWDTPYENELTGIDRKYISILSENQRHIYRHYSALYTEKIKKEEISEDEFKRKDYSYRLYLRLLLVTDYLSGMTDSFIKTLYQELMGID